MRQTIIFIVALLALAGSVTAALATRDLRDFDLRGYADPAQSDQLPYRLPRPGVNADLLQYTPQELRQQLDWMQQANIRWVRQVVAWDRVEPERGQYRWQSLDEVFAALNDYPTIQPVIVLFRSPAWARTTDSATAPPDDPADFARFAASFATRYGEQVDHYQIWDEPNLDDAWGLGEPRPAEYAALLAEAYRAIHGADGDASILLAALAPTVERAGMNIADTLYLEALYALGAGEYFDAAAAKPYGFNNPPDDRRVSIDVLNFSRIILLREIMVANGDSQKALWASNWGWNSLSSDWEGEASPWGQVSIEQQTAYVVAALERAEREWPWLGGMILQHWQPDVAPNNPQWGFAVIDKENTPTPLWQTLVDYEWPTAASNGLYHPQTEYARYSGLWTFSELGADIGWLETSDSQLEFDFVGRDISLLLREDDYFAFLYLAIDHQAVNATPRDASGNPYILLRSGSRQPEINLVAVARDLPDGVHTMRVVADRGWDRWALAGYAVSDGNLAVPYDRQILIAWWAAAAAFLATVISGAYLPWSVIKMGLQRPLRWMNTVAQAAIAITTSLALMAGMLLSFGTPDPNIFRREMLDSFALVIVTGGLLVIELPFLLVVVASLILFWLIYHRLLWGLLLIILYAPFFLFPVELYTFAFPMAELLTLLTGAAWALRVLIQWGTERQSANSDYPLRLPITWHPMDGLMIAWGLLATVALVWSEQRGAALTEWRTLFVEPLIFYAVLRTIELDLKHLRWLMDALVISGVLVAVIGLVLFGLGEAIITAEAGARRLASVYGSPNNVGLWLGRALPFALAGVLLATVRWRKIIYGCAWVVMMIAGVLTWSVGALLIGIPAGIAVVLLLTFKRRALVPLFGLAIIGLVAAGILTQISARFAGLLDISSGTNFLRLRLWESTLELLHDHPLRGLGLDQFLYAYRGHYIRPDAIADPDLSHPHNIALDFWVRLGIGGVLWLMAFVALYWRRMLAMWRTMNANPIQQQIIIGAMGAMAALLAHGMIDNSVFVNDLVFVFVLLAGLAVRLPRFVTA